VARLKERLHAEQPALNSDALIQGLAALLEQRSRSAPLQWIRASVGQAITMIAVGDIDFLRAEDKYTTVAWRDEKGVTRDGVIRISLKDIATQLDPAQFAQVHRSVLVNLGAVARVVRGDNETAEIHLKGRPEVLPVSRSYLHLFKQM
jgi:DNA-binding LytR/AlgR family response regulator